LLLGANEVKTPQTQHRWEQRRGLAQLSAELARTSHASPCLSVRRPVRGVKRKAQRELQHELAARAFGSVRQRREQLQAAAGEGGGLPIAEDAGCVLRGEREVVYRARHLSRRLEQKRKLGRNLCAALAIMREQGFGDRQALRLSASRGEAGTKSVLIQDVHEAIPHRWRPVGERMLAHRLHEGVHAPEDVELLLDLAR